MTPARTIHALLWLLLAVCAFGVVESLSVGTRSVLYGAHCFATHWFFVARGWYKLYGWKPVKIGVRSEFEWEDPIRPIRWYAECDVMTSLFDPRLWLSFFLHDIGYLGQPNMDGEEGEKHPLVAAKLMSRLFGEPWGSFVLYHSRFYAKRDGHAVSRLCYADKMAIVVTPAWLAVLQASLTGEIHEYMDRYANNANSVEGFEHRPHTWADRFAWNRQVREYMRSWLAAHRDGQLDTWTPTRRDG